MELNEFVRQALIDITEGVTDAQKKTSGVQIPTLFNNAFTKMTAENWVKLVACGVTEIQLVHFEVNVKAESQIGGKAKISVVSWILNSEAKAEGSSGEQRTATLKFSVPISLPSIPQHERPKSPP
jgi:hypothetical protein